MAYGRQPQDIVGDNPNKSQNYGLVKGRTCVRVVNDHNLDVIDAALTALETNPHAYSQKTSHMVVVKTLSVGKGLVLDDDGEGNFVIRTEAEFKKMPKQKPGDHEVRAQLLADSAKQFKVDDTRKDKK
ncbi:MAG: hypothetical protein LAN64_01890 [Acidobacteriia bacterium]|nr:hypothetical protein [Terriglobia bacterium]